MSRVQSNRGWYLRYPSTSLLPGSSILRVIGEATRSEALVSRPGTLHLKNVDCGDFERCNWRFRALHGPFYLDELFKISKIVSDK